MFILKSIAAAIVSAILFNPSHDNAVIKTPSNRVHASSSFEMTFDLHGDDQHVRLTLTPNHDVLAEGATLSVLGQDGSIESSETIDRSQYRVFKGDAWLQHYRGSEWINVGWARILVHMDGKRPIFEGAFRMDGDHHHVQTNTNYMQTKHALDPVIEPAEEEYMVVWRDSDISADPLGAGEYSHAELKRSIGGAGSCSADGLTFNSQADHPVFRAMSKREDRFWGSASTRSLFTRQIDGQTTGNGAGVNLLTSIGSTDGCPTTRKVALVGVVTDCSYGADFNSTASVRKNVIALVNSASQVYESTFNITLGLKNLTVTPTECPAIAAADTPWNTACTTGDIQTRLNQFSAWRGEASRSGDGNAYWTLLSTCATDSAVGLAWLGQVCVGDSQVSSTTTGNETVSGANVVVRTGTEWQVFAHETGHTFGAVHDCTSTTCADNTTVASQQCCSLSTTVCDAGGKYIMNPSTGSDITAFSPCSVGNICAAIGRNSVKTTCLTANKNVTTITGSQCGNGIVEEGEDCDCGGTTGCTDNACCDATTCKFQTTAFAGNGTLCRASTGACDPQETCSGTASTCPVDVTAPDGTTCGTSLTCASGQCTSRDLQCKTLMGSYTAGNDTYACESTGCQVSCAAPEFGANICYSMQQNFLDGTSCGGGGKCDNGVCQGSTVGNEITNWITKNKKLVIILASVIGGLCRRSSRNRKRLASGPVGPPPGWTGNAGQWGAPRGQAPNYFQQPQMNQMGGGQAWRGSQASPPPVWQPSMRYACVLVIANGLIKDQSTPMKLRREDFEGRSGFKCLFKSATNSL
ncbi:ADAM family of metalloprotease-like protein ADM-B [Calycina marina]|uniref:ADAM family of metalloprotease-like protein ADM-B n=1 Tax=Calycina marina TaxID=1763456 RepID=A0A9P7ZBQ6_9HELO|nr:ADAM family of metalloprotease-like protein ADM-B [Calycina marina]